MQKRLLGILATAAIVVAACGGATQSTAPTASTGTAPSGEASAPPASAAAGEQTITMVMDGDVSGGLSNAADNVPTAEAAQFLYNGLYEYDEALTPVPSLAESLATISEDGLTWTIKLRSGVKFHDGTDLTADDVVQDYQMAQSPNCRFNPSVCLATFLDKVEKVDDLTVKFTLKQKLSTFATIYLPAILIESKDAIDASYAKYVAGTKAVTAADTKAFLDKFNAETATPTGPAGDDGVATPNYAQFIAEGEALLTKAGVALPDKAPFTTDGVVDENGYATALSTAVTAVDATFTASAIDALAAAYPYLDFQRNPVGTGAFAFVSFKPGESLEYKANEDYFLGAPAVKKFFIPIIKDDTAGGQALAAGQVDWKYSLTGPTYNEIKDNPDLKFVEYPDFGFFGLYFNMREGQLFSDVNLRQAVSYCFDKEATAEAATGGQGVAVYSDIPPASWAYPTEGLNTYPMDPAKSKELIEKSGWTLGSDGIYEKAGKKLSTVVAVRAERPDRSKWMQLVSDQVKACGIDIQFKEIDFAAILNMLDVFPHINAAAPESGKPFDAYFGGFSTSLDPDPFSLYHSSQCSTAEQPSTFNYECYKNPEVDKLIDEGLVEFDQAKRAAIYAQYAILQSNDLPVLYAWSDIAREGLRATVDTTAEGGIQMDSPTWFRQVEKLTNVK
jgi:ABC-type transport system substrate-binding protein